MVRTLGGSTGPWLRYLRLPPSTMPSITVHSPRLLKEHLPTREAMASDLGQRGVKAEEVRGHSGYLGMSGPRVEETRPYRLRDHPASQPAGAKSLRSSS